MCTWWGAYALRDKILLEKGDKPLWFTGHSKGAAEATILAHWYAGAGYNVKGLITFGCPRVGNKAFAKSVKKNIPYIHRYQNRFDCVPRHPWPIWGYRHVTDAIKLASGTHSIRGYVTNLAELALQEGRYGKGQ